MKPAEQLTERERALLGPRALKAVGSPEWCWQTVTYLRDSLRHVDERWRQIEPILAELEQARAWEKIPPGKPYGSFDKLLREEAGLDRQSIKKRLDEIKPAARHGAIGNGRSRDGATISTSQPNVSEHVVARLKRDDPELAGRVVKGEVTPNAAAMQKGWRKPRIVVSTPASVATALRRHMEPEQLADLIRLLLAGDEP